MSGTKKKRLTHNDRINKLEVGQNKLEAGQNKLEAGQKETNGKLDDLIGLMQKMTAPLTPSIEEPITVQVQPSTPNLEKARGLDVILSDDSELSIQDKVQLASKEQLEAIIDIGESHIEQEKLAKEAALAAKQEIANQEGDKLNKKASNDTDVIELSLLTNKDYLLQKGNPFRDAYVVVIHVNNKHAVDEDHYVNAERMNEQLKKLQKRFGEKSVRYSYLNIKGVAALKSQGWQGTLKTLEKQLQTLNQLQRNENNRVAHDIVEKYARFDYRRDLYRQIKSLE